MPAACVKLKPMTNLNLNKCALIIITLLIILRSSCWLTSRLYVVNPKFKFHINSRVCACVDFVERVKPSTKHFSQQAMSAPNMQKPCK